VIIVSGHLGDQVRDAVERIDTRGLRVTVLQEEDQRGTTAALAFAASTIKTDEFLVILGDILMSLPIQDFIDQWRASTKSVGVVVHPSTHPADSDAVFQTHEGTVHITPKGQQREHVPNLSSAGLFAVNRWALEKYGESKDLGSNVLQAAAHESDLFVFLTSHYLKDTGTPDRLRSAESDIASGAFARRGSLEPRPALFLDRDGVINHSQPEVYQPEQFALLPGVAEAIKKANSSGIPGHSCD
jgi:Nucleoside-diphosphate-sugar pyrophosphorylase involved in lipopolysaccharide biosynthesis/translation initiation factor 2B, gamma/epsilon subunits (eIF-2Bgamma/eIF-2Bepsilon)